MTDIPQWAWEMARRLRDEEQERTPSLCPMDRAFAAYILAHEEPPVDPLLIEARKLASVDGDHPLWIERLNSGQADDDYRVVTALKGIRRGIEIAALSKAEKP